MTPERVSEIYDMIMGFEIALEKDPTVGGPRQLNSNIAECRNFLNQTTKVLLELAREKHDLQRQLSGAEGVHEVREAELLANDERVRRLPSISDRQAMVKTMLHEEIQTIRRIKGDIASLEAMNKAVTIRHAELVRTDAQIKTQRAVIRDELDSGAFYGDETEGAAPRGRKRPVESMEDIDKVLAEFSNPAPAPVAPPLVVTAPVPELVAAPTPVLEPTPPPSPVGTPDPERVMSDDDDVKEFLRQAESETANLSTPSDEDDITRFLADGVSEGGASKTRKPKKAAKPAPEKAPKPPTADDDFDFDSILSNF